MRHKKYSFLYQQVMNVFYDEFHPGSGPEQVLAKKHKMYTNEITFQNKLLSFSHSCWYMGM